MKQGDVGDGTDMVEDILTVLEYYKALGLDRIPVTLSKQAPPVAGRRAAVPAGRIPQKKETAENQAGEVREPLSPYGDKSPLLKSLREELGDCQRCKLAPQRRNIVFGEGDPGARLMFIGEAPGKEEDIQGMPFVGDAGMLLTKLIEKMGLRRSDVYIANIIKCRPPMNRDPEEDETSACRPFIEGQIRIIRPDVIVTLGRIAVQTLMNNPRLKITAARGNFLEYEGIPLMPTFHPAYLLRNPKDKWLTWADAQKVMERLQKEA